MKLQTKLRRQSFQVITVILLNVACAISINRECTEQPISLLDIQNALLATEAAYKEDVEGRVIKKTGFQVVKVVTKYLKNDDAVVTKYVDYDVEEDGDRLRVLIAKRDDYDGKTTIIAFRGTDRMLQILDKFKTDLQNYGEAEVFFHGKAASVNKYIWSAFAKLYYHIEKYLYHKGRRYIITGHSIGGGMASLLALMTKSRRKGLMWDHPGTCLITFGAPRVGNKSYADLHEKFISPTRKLRFVNRFDVVPHLPETSDYQHHSREIWMNKQTTKLASLVIVIVNNTRFTYWKICGENEPSYCSNRVSTLHLSPFDHGIIKYKSKIMNPPGNYYSDRSSTAVTSWEDAFIESCPSKQKESSFTLPMDSDDGNENDDEGKDNELFPVLPAKPFEIEEVEDTNPANITRIANKLRTQLRTILTKKKNEAL